MSVVAVLCADIHLSHRPPIARSAEPDWYRAMARPLKELDELACKHDVPILCAGDVFESWNSCPELINFAIENLPKMYAVPGQHDMPHHNYDDLRRSAYWTLVKAGVIENLTTCQLCDLVLWPYPFGMRLSSVHDRVRMGNMLYVAIVHSYIWINGTEYPGAPKERHLSSFKSELRGYDVAVFGDNHKGFLTGSGKCNVMNCGCLIRRKIDEREYVPSVGLLHSDGSITRHFLDTSEDKWIKGELGETVGADDNPALRKFLVELEQLDGESLDFRETVRRYVNDNDLVNETRRVLLKALGD